MTTLAHNEKMQMRNEYMDLCNALYESNFLQFCALLGDVAEFVKKYHDQSFSKLLIDDVRINEERLLP